MLTDLEGESFEDIFFFGLRFDSALSGVGRASVSGCPLGRTESSSLLSALPSRCAASDCEVLLDFFLFELEEGGDTDSGRDDLVLGRVTGCTPAWLGRLGSVDSEK